MIYLPTINQKHDPLYFLMKTKVSRDLSQDAVLFLFGCLMDAAKIVRDEYKGETLAAIMEAYFGVNEPELLYSDINLKFQTSTPKIQYCLNKVKMYIACDPKFKHVKANLELLQKGELPADLNDLNRDTVYPGYNELKIRQEELEEAPERKVISAREMKDALIPGDRIGLFEGRIYYNLEKRVYKRDLHLYDIKPHWRAQLMAEAVDDPSEIPNG